MFYGVRAAAGGWAAAATIAVQPAGAAAGAKPTLGRLLCCVTVDFCERVKLPTRKEMTSYIKHSPEEEKRWRETGRAAIAAAEATVDAVPVVVVVVAAASAPAAAAARGTAAAQRLLPVPTSHAVPALQAPSLYT